MYHYGDFGPSARPKEIYIRGVESDIPQINPVRRPLTFNSHQYGSLNLPTTWKAEIPEKLVTQDDAIIVSPVEKKRLIDLWETTLNNPAPRIPPQYPYSTKKADVLEAFRSYERRRQSAEANNNLPQINGHLQRASSATELREAINQSTDEQRKMSTTVITVCDKEDQMEPAKSS